MKQSTFTVKCIYADNVNSEQIAGMTMHILNSLTCTGQCIVASVPDAVIEVVTVRNAEANTFVAMDLCTGEVVC